MRSRLAFYCPNYDVGGPVLRAFVKAWGCLSKDEKWGLASDMSHHDIISLADRIEKAYENYLTGLEHWKLETHPGTYHRAEFSFVSGLENLTLGLSPTAPLPDGALAHDESLRKQLTTELRVALPKNPGPAEVLVTGAKLMGNDQEKRVSEIVTTADLSHPAGRKPSDPIIVVLRWKKMEGAYEMVQIAPHIHPRPVDPTGGLGAELQHSAIGIRASAARDTLKKELG